MSSKRTLKTSSQGATKKARFSKPKKKRVSPSPVNNEENEDELSHKEDSSSIRKGRTYTVSIALPGSIIDNAQSAELKTYLAGQIARAAAVFNVDEIIVFNESIQSQGVSNSTNCNLFLARILQYLETPQYLRKQIFPKHSDLQYAGLLNPLDAPHHLRQDEVSEYREGIVLDRPVKSGCGSFVNAGLKKEVQIDKCIKPNVRVTIQLVPNTKTNPKYLTGKVVSPNAPRTDAGIYWGYTVRLANTFGAVFTESSYKDGYDLTIGTSDKGDDISAQSELPEFKHLLLVFGGLQGLEASLESDENLTVDDVSLLFQFYWNTCPNQGSRTIRTEEAILITLSTLKPLIEKSGFRK
ncbi:putative methyltransferase C9orf114 isoform X2 [Dysidea avara]|uniref:putative methyltransferase C9orf114 isoform X2 n=1 Tax=Dysidea avara TaxID=196820 RepID=UPI00332B020D